MEKKIKRITIIQVLICSEIRSFKSKNSLKHLKTRVQKSCDIPTPSLSHAVFDGTAPLPLLVQQYVEHAYNK
jgi:hypothetical protein